jgi:two-component system, response regulator RpfG
MRSDGQDMRSLGQEVQRCHHRLLAELPGVDRVALAVFDSGGGTLRTFAHSTRGAAPLALYEAGLDDVASLAALARERRDRVIDDLGVLPATGSEHARWLAASGYRSSFTRPVFEGDELQGFLFCDSMHPAYFTPPALERLTVHAELLSLLLSRALAPVKVLRSAVRLALEMSQLRDEETGAHLQRMSRYARVIAAGLAARHGLTDEQVEYVFGFAPMHESGAGYRFVGSRPAAWQSHAPTTTRAQPSQRPAPGTVRR